MPRPRRQTRRQTDFMDATSEDGDRGDQAEPHGTVPFATMAAMLATLQKSQIDAFEQLLNRQESRISMNDSTTASSSSSGNFSKCTARFEGESGDVEAFIDAISSYRECRHVSDSNAIRGMSMLLTGHAAVWWQSAKTEIHTWDELVSRLRSAFGDERPPYKIYKDLLAMNQGNEKTDLFVARARMLLSKLPPGDLSENARMDIVYGLLDRRIRKRVRREEITSFPDILRLARIIEESLGEATTDSTPVSNYPPSTSTSRATCEPPSATPASHSSRRTTAPPVVSAPLRKQSVTHSDFSKSKSRFCVYCKQYGHSRDDCHKLSKNAKSDNNTVDPKPVSCYGCGLRGVIRSQCSNCNKNVTFSSIDLEHSSYEFNSNVSCQCHNSNLVSHDLNVNSNNLCTCKHNLNSIFRHKPQTNVNHTPFDHSLVQTVNSDHRCSHSNFFNPTIDQSKSLLAQRDSDHHVPLPISASVPNCVNNEFTTPTPVVETHPCDVVKAHTLVKGHTHTDSCEFVPFYSGDISGTSSASENFRATTAAPTDTSDYLVESTPCLFSADTPGRKLRPILCIQILGMRGTALIDTAAKCNVAGHTLFSLLKQKGVTFVRKFLNVKLADGDARQREVLEAHLEVTISVTKTFVTTFLVLPDAADNDTLLGIDFLIAAGMVIDFADSTWHFSGNSQSYPLEYEDMRSVPTQVPAPRVAVSSFQLRDDEGTAITCVQRQQLTEVIQRHEDIFSLGGGVTPYAEHHIDTGDHPPIAAPPYRVTPAKRAIMERELNKLLDAGVIEECDSAWASPVVLIPKKDGTHRFCVDYRRLNAVTKTDAYPLPVIDELLHSTQRDCYISTIDLRSSYHQVSVFPADRDKTSFITPLGTYRFTRMPFGLKNAPSTFQRLMDRFRSSASLRDVSLLCYLDDIYICSQGFERHLDDLNKVFNRLREFGLRANREKCVFAAREVKYLGHLITPDGIKPDKAKIEAIVQMKEPTSLKHLKTFLQTCAWFRKFIPSFSQIAHPMTKLTRKDQPWVWDREQREAFEKLKVSLTTAPVLVQADYSKPFILRTDASNYALGAVLLQGDTPAEEHPIEYASRLLTPAERKYSTTEREALAVIWAVEKYRPYIDGHVVIVRSDHQPLKWLLTLKSPSGRLTRWALKLQSFNIQYEYTPGKANVIADTLSRPNCDGDSPEDCGVCSVTIDVPRADPEELRKAQLEDPELSTIIQDLEQADALASSRWLERGYLMNQGVLYRHGPDSDSEESQLVLPSSMVEAVLKEFHDAPTAGHQGVERTLDRIRQRYYFNGMRKRVTDYLKNCINCQRYKYSNLKPAGLLQTPVLQQRGEVLAIDLFGPLPEADTGEKWIFLVEDAATRWVELYALREATAEVCARTLTEEYFLRFGFPRRIISDNGVQFVSAVMQQCMHLFGIKQNLIPAYHPEANPAERKNRDLKVQLSILVENEHRSWPLFLSQIRFSLNSATCCTTGLTPSYMMFARQMRTPFDAHHDLRAVLDKDNFVPQVTPYLKRFITSMYELRDRVELRQDSRKETADASRRPAPAYQKGDLILLTTHALSNAHKGVTRKFMPRRDGPYVINRIVSPTSYEVVDQDGQILGRFHSTDITPYVGPNSRVEPVQPRRVRGRPRNPSDKDASLQVKPPSGRSGDLKEEHVTRSRGDKRPIKLPLKYRA